MKKILCSAFLLSTSLTANAAILTFDDIPGGSIQNTADSMSTYKGFNFSNTLFWGDLVDSIWNYGAHSGDFAIVNNFSGTGVITEENGADFTFDGLWAKRWGTNDSGSDSLFGTLAGYNNGNLIWSVNTSLNGIYEFYGAQSGLIDELRLGFGDQGFLVDDIALNEVSNVPVPAAVWLFGSGLVGLLGFNRKRNQSLAA
jgi:hypothetical protein